jgi:class 3 adenylate cyclase
MSETRKIAAILVSDVVGYSRLAGRDEERTLARLRALRSELINPAVAAHNGRIVKSTGDGSLVEFRSVVDAVRCAVVIQKGMGERNAGIPPDRRIVFRVGVHLGDVVEESDGDLMGDGVNIAARLEGISSPGAICLSEDAYRQVKTRLDLVVTDLGPTQLKNLPEPIRAYSVQVGKSGRPSGFKPARRRRFFAAASIATAIVSGGGLLWLSSAPPPEAPVASVAADAASAEGVAPAHGLAPAQASAPVQKELDKPTPQIAPKQAHLPPAVHEFRRAAWIVKPHGGAAPPSPEFAPSEPSNGATPHPAPALALATPGDSFCHFGESSCRIVHGDLAANAAVVPPAQAFAIAPQGEVFCHFGESACRKGHGVGSGVSAPSPPPSSDGQSP